MIDITISYRSTIDDIGVLTKIYLRVVIAAFYTNIHILYIYTQYTHIYTQISDCTQIGLIWTVKATANALVYKNVKCAVTNAIIIMIHFCFDL